MNSTFHRAARRCSLRSFLIALLCLGAFNPIQAAPQPVFRGVDYVLVERTVPRPLRVHLVKIDLTSPAVRVLSTPGEVGQEKPFAAQTTSAFLEKWNCQIAVNGDFFEPFHSKFPWDYFPHAGDAVKVLGAARFYPKATPEHGISVSGKTKQKRPRFCPRR